jgi:hypothetical protein
MTRTGKEKRWPWQLLGEKIIKKGSTIEKMPATTNTSLFQGGSCDFQSEDSAHKL